LRELAHLAFGFLGAPLLILGAALEHAQAPRDGDGDDQPEDQAAADERREFRAKGLLASCDFGALCGEVLIIQLFDLLGQVEHGVAAGQHLAAEEPGAVVDLFRNRPIEERFEALPIRFEVRFEIANAGFVFAASARDLVKFLYRLA
jgi:hypothetical protein